MELNDQQKQTMAKWVAEKRSIGDIQKLLAEQFKMSMTYMDVRFLLIDLGLDVKDDEAKKRFGKTDLKGGPQAPGAIGDEADLGEPGAGGVSVTLDKIIKPGSIVSGTVKFSDGVSANWMLDQTGRLALDAGKKNYRPSQEDLQAFQMEVSRQLQSHGY